MIEQTIKTVYLKETIEGVLSKNIGSETVKSLVENAPRDALRYAMVHAEGDDWDFLMKEHETLREEQLASV